MTKNARLLRILDKQNLSRLLIVCLACGSLFLQMGNFVYRKWSYGRPGRLLNFETQAGVFA